MQILTHTFLTVYWYCMWPTNHQKSYFSFKDTPYYFVNVDIWYWKNCYFLGSYARAVVKQKTAEETSDINTDDVYLLKRR